MDMYILHLKTFHSATFYSDPNFTARLYYINVSRNEIFYSKHLKMPIQATRYFDFLCRLSPKIREIRQIIYFKYSSISDSTCKESIPVCHHLPPFVLFDLQHLLTCKSKRIQLFLYIKKGTNR